MIYRVSSKLPGAHLIEIEFIADKVSGPVVDICLPAWRPGRYELGNFAKNIQRWSAYDEKGNVLKSRKASKDRWQVETAGAKSIHVRYTYYGAELNAGSTYSDDKQLYINPANCMLYIPGRLHEECTVELEIPADYNIATGMNKISRNVLKSSGFDQLADCPLVASASLQHNMFVYEGIEFHIWFQGDFHVDWPKIIGDFFIFVNEQYEMMKEFPSPEYHFIYQIVPHKFHHGVEHLNSTVIVLGPAYHILREQMYNEFLSISSHELFHAWNIKMIRPAEMMPYDYSRENYSSLGYVAEGVTTYYGDLLLYRSGIFSYFDYFKTLYENLQKYLDNFGRYNNSVAASSFDTWLDGYQKGIPDRVVSIYSAGCLIALMTDLLIRKHSSNKKSLDDVMKMLYYEYAKKGKGYTEADYKQVIETIAGTSFDGFFNDYVWGVVPCETQLRECLDYIGCELVSVNSRKYYEAFLGFKVAEISNIVSAVFPGSVAAFAGLNVDDDIVAVNNCLVKNDLHEWCRYFAGQSTVLTVKKNQQFHNIEMKSGKETFYKIHYINKIKDPSPQQVENFRLWAKRNF